MNCCRPFMQIWKGDSRKMRRISPALSTTPKPKLHGILKKDKTQPRVELAGL
jgi:hypothetical protein